MTSVTATPSSSAVFLEMSPWVSGETSFGWPGRSKTLKAPVPRLSWAQITSSKQAYQNHHQQIPEAVPVSRLLVWPVAARPGGRVAFKPEASP